MGDSDFYVRRDYIIKNFDLLEAKRNDDKWKEQYAIN